MDNVDNTYIEVIYEDLHAGHFLLPAGISDAQALERAEIHAGRNPKATVNIVKGGVLQRVVQRGYGYEI